ncbi:MAG TPA: PaaI family thioesterase [Candidatus Mediterraneibacter colneyensis]|nr:PaaI family thioesterase [Candidatus Mediterraneibacter colneyensis]
MDYERLCRIRNEQNAFGNLVGVRIVEIREGYARSELEVRRELSNPIGSLHGGVYFTMADITGGSAAVAYGEQVTTVDADIRYLRPGIGIKKVICEAEEIKKGKQLFVYRVDLKDEKGTLLSAGTFTYMSLHKAVEL